MIPSPATPPTTPPAIAPAFDPPEDPFELDPEEDPVFEDELEGPDEVELAFGLGVPDDSAALLCASASATVALNASSAETSRYAQ